jgi:omega-6 fatty acid desaturase (delta-12 desaturase)
LESTRVTDSGPGVFGRKLDAYRKSNSWRGLWELSVTAGALLAIWAVAFLVFHLGLWWVGLLLTAPAALFLVRLFMIQHDCGHGSFFSAKAANDWVGRVIGVLTLTPYDYWRSTHAMHHATSGNLDRRGTGDITTLTVDEYVALSPMRRFGYRFYRHPLVLFGIGPFVTFFILQRLPVGLMKAGWRPWLSTMGTTAAAAVLLTALILIFGPAPALLVTLPTMLLGATIGVWLFFVQHQFDGVAWARHSSWGREEAALRGSSHYDLPQPLRWFTANIGVHHVHHLNSRIPFYRLPQVLRDLPELKAMSRLRLLESFKCAMLAVWDETSGRLITFRAMRRKLRAPA